MKYFLAIDIGASSGRHILGWIENNVIKLEEIHRFKNQIEKINNHLCWNIDYLYEEIIKGLKKCKEINKIPQSIAIDTWAVDYALLDENKNRIGEVVAYRDSRTENTTINISYEELYKRTGIQKQKFNTIYQLKATAKKDIEKASYLLMVPDYLNYLLTGEIANEYTNATTTNLVSPITKDWDYDLIEEVRLPKKLFKSLKKPGTYLGNFKREIVEEVGFNCKVIMAASHDTASAVMAVPSLTDQPLYISSGTWSLIGTELEEADCSINSYKANITNEGGYNYRFRYLKNIMGLWMVQEAVREYEYKYDFATFCNMASNADINSYVDVFDDCFLAPESMINEVKNYCHKTKQQVPETPSEVALVIYQSLAKGYDKAIKELELLTNHNYDVLHIVGGGSKAEYLNVLTAKHTGKTILAGPDEATALGNLLCQMISEGIISDLKEARKMIIESFNIRKYEEK